MLALPASCCRVPRRFLLLFVALTAGPLVHRTILLEDRCFGQEMHPADGFIVQAPPPAMPTYGSHWLAAFHGWPPIYTRVEYLSWWTSGPSDQPLVSTSVPTPAGAAGAGALGMPGTRVLYDAAGTDDARPGLRAHLGLWLDACRSSGIEATYLGLDEWTNDFFGDQQAWPVLARPFASAAGFSDSHLIAFPGIQDGGVTVSAATRFDSIEMVYRRIFRPAPAMHWDVLVGYRHSRLDDSLSIQESFTSLDAASAQPTGTTTLLSDSFSVDNRFNGVQLGLVSFTRQGRWGLELSTRLAIGDTRTKVSIFGERTVTADGVPATSPYGLLAQPTNAGQYEKSTFTAIPELGLNLTYNITHHTSVTLGYRVLYWTSVSWAADQIDPVVNLSQVPPDTLSGAARPEFRLVPTGFWAQGITAGVDIRF